MIPMVFENTQKIPVLALNDNGRKLVISSLNELLVHCGFDLFRKFMLEIKYPKEPEKQGKIIYS